MKKYFFTFTLLFFFNTVSAAKINFTTDKTQINSDEVLQVHLSIDGDVDGGQVGIKGLEAFTVVGQQSSSQIQVINGDMQSIQEETLSLSPQSEGTFTLTALAKENGEEIESSSITIKVNKSLIQSTKEALLKTSTSEEASKNTQDSDTQSTLKKLLKNKTPTENIQSEDYLKSLSSPPLENFPKVQHISAFNAMFWLEFIGIFLFIAAVFTAFLYGFKKIKKS